jgi:hypothetical protein
MTLEADCSFTRLTEAETTAERFPGLVGGGAVTQFKLQVAQFGELFTTIHMFRRTAGKVVSFEYFCSDTCALVACLTQFFQQMSDLSLIRIISI